jgi:hypothetical protein
MTSAVQREVVRQYMLKVRRQQAPAGSRQQAPAAAPGWQLQLPHTCRRHNSCPRPQLTPAGPLPAAPQSNQSEAARSLRWEPTMRKFPHPALDATSIVGFVIGPFIFAACMFSFVTQVRALALAAALGAGCGGRLLRACWLRGRCYPAAGCLAAAARPAAPPLPPPQAAAWPAARPKVTDSGPCCSPRSWAWW